MHPPLPYGLAHPPPNVMLHAGVSAGNSLTGSPGHCTNVRSCGRLSLVPLQLVDPLSRECLLSSGFLTRRYDKSELFC